MKFISITKSISIKPNWGATIAEVLKAGTPLSIEGTPYSDGTAIGILADDAHRGDGEVSVVTEGVIDLEEVTRSYGELSCTAIEAMKGITFIGEHSGPITPVPPRIGSVGGAFLTTNTDGRPLWERAGFFISLEGALSVLWNAAYSAAGVAENGEATLATLITGDAAETANELVDYAYETVHENRRPLVLGELLSVDSNEGGVVTSVTSSGISYRFTYLDRTVSDGTLTQAATVETDVAMATSPSGVAVALRVKITPATIV